MSNIVNKAKNTFSGDNAYEAPEGTHGPHSSRIANAADPRVDSDRDHRGAPPPGGVGATTGAYEGNFGRTHEPGSTTGGAYETREGAHGPHSSRIANAADPRVDSDRDHRANPASNVGGTGYTGTGTGHTTGGLGHSTGHTTGLGSTGHSTGHTLGSSGAPEGTHGPHSSRVANAADPRVDSDRDHRGAHGTTLGSSGATGTGAGSHLGASAPGPAPNTAGPHKSDLLNKLDPRVDSDLDGSKTIGGNKTYGADGLARDPTDAAQVPPSVLRKHIGEPSIEHGDHSHHRERRNSTATAQESHRGL